ncbi:MAG: bifunctional adenosylcobinamide kinase/adenosylcobinamide-phosphate guanylyltransferase [Acidiferrobacterales bacterium]|nr:bifunctional adenosylcobinamide kinase/adenosylcobinamide-phosphate guanylyltransferase [Acidiferrobacterales bacterium]
MIELVAGGARSGKSRYALDRASATAGEHIFVATATGGDEGMDQRIARHQAERGNEWNLIEEPICLSAVIKQSSEGQVLLVDCLTLWLTNWLCSEESNDWPIEKKRFLTALKAAKSQIFLVTNEVSLGVVPMGQLSRDFVDEAGWLHQDVASIADRVTMVTFGIPTAIKKPGLD